MAIRERPQKNKTGKVYEIYFTYKNLYGQTKRYSKSGFTTKKEAKAHEALKRAECATYGELVTSKKKTFNDVFEEYMEVEGANKYASSTKIYYQNTFVLYIKDTSIANKDIFKIRYKELQLFFNEISPLGTSTVKNIKKVFSATFKYAMRVSYIPSNPMLMVTIMPDERKNENLEITEEQFKEICRRVFYLNKYSPDRDAQIWNNFVFYLALEIGWYLGLRISETLALRKDDFNLKRRTVHIQRRLEYQRLKREDMYLTDKMKTKKSNAYLPVAEPLADLLQLWFNENPYDYVVCDIDGKLIHPSTINFRYRKIGKEINIDFHYHMLRHSLASRLARNNISPALAKEMLRHSMVATTLEKYTHVNDQDKKNAMEKLVEIERK